MATSKTPAKTAAKKAGAPAKAAAKPASPKAAKAPPAAKSAAAKSTAPAKAPAAKKTGAKPKREIPAEQRRNYVEVAAYFIAERHGFTPGRELHDWAEAEAEIDRLLSAGLLNPQE